MCSLGGDVDAVENMAPAIVNLVKSLPLKESPSLNVPRGEEVVAGRDTRVVRRSAAAVRAVVALPGHLHLQRGPSGGEVPGDVASDRLRRRVGGASDGRALRRDGEQRQVTCSHRPLRRSSRLRVLSRSFLRLRLLRHRSP